MKKIFLLTFAALFSFAVCANAQDGIKWETGTLNEVLNKAKSNNSTPNIVFLDCYTSWCGPCKYMAESVFTTKEAGDYFNNRFVNFKMDMEKGEGKEVAKKYNVRAYPTFLILDSDGNEIGRIVGGGKLEDFVKKVEKAAKFTK